MRVWFEREMIVFPYGDDSTRRKVNILLEELNTHAWRDGMIIDLGRHNDCAMAMAHALDQFVYKTPDMPSVFKTMNKGAWQGGKTRINRTPTTFGGKVIKRGR
tara:strand:- start:416 stop:724 length:309 start_codon:yes stop_codon:yes gene_type:complete